MIPAVSLDAYTAARQRAGLVDRADRARIVVSGADRAAFLQGLLTNDLAAPGDGTLVYGAMLTPKGMIVFDAWVLREPEAFTIVTGGSAPGGPRAPARAPVAGSVIEAESDTAADSVKVAGSGPILADLDDPERSAC